MAYWIFVTNEENWHAVRKNNVWGLPEGRENSIKRVKPGDLAFIYVMQTKKGDKIIPSRIVALYEVVSKPFRSTSRIFKGGTYPNRVKLKPLKIAKRPIDFKSLIPKLKFVKNKQYWTGYLRSGLASIHEDDYRLIKEKIK